MAHYYPGTNKCRTRRHLHGRDGSPRHQRKGDASQRVTARRVDVLQPCREVTLAPRSPARSSGRAVVYRPVWIGGRCLLPPICIANHAGGSWARSPGSLSAYRPVRLLFVALPQGDSYTVSAYTPISRRRRRAANSRRRLAKSAGSLAMCSRWRSTTARVSPSSAP